MKRLLVIGCLVSIAAGVGYLLWPSDEGRIAKVFKECVGAIETKRSDIVMSHISFNYRDDYGMSYLHLKERLKRTLDPLSDITVQYEDLEIRVDGNAATADVAVRVIATMGTETGYFFGDVKDPLHLRLTLQKERTRWLITKAEQRSPGGGRTMPDKI